MNKIRIKKCYLLTAICSINLVTFSLPALAACKAGIDSMKVTQLNETGWQTAHDQSSGIKQIKPLHNGQGFLVKISSDYLNPMHHFDKDMAILPIEGSVTISLNGKKIDLTKGDYLTIPAGTCFIASSKTGATFALFGAHPGKSVKD